MAVTDNGWFNINYNQPAINEEVVVIVERDNAPGCDYDFKVCDSQYRCHGINGYFSVENEVWKVKYWRRKDKYPYPNGVVAKKLTEDRKRGINSSDIIEHQKECGINYDVEWENNVLRLITYIPMERQI